MECRRDPGDEEEEQGDGQRTHRQHLNFAQFIACDDWCAIVFLLIHVDEVFIRLYGFAFGVEGAATDQNLLDNLILGQGGSPIAVFVFQLHKCREKFFVVRVHERFVLLIPPDERAIIVGRDLSSVEDRWFLVVVVVEIVLHGCVASLSLCL